MSTTRDRLLGLFQQNHHHNYQNQNDGNHTSRQETTYQVDEGKSTAILQSTVFLEDAINFRSIHHKTERNSLIVYRCYYSRSIQNILSLNIFVILMLSFFETPSSLSWSSDITMPKEYIIRYEFPCGVLESIDLFCLILFIGDAIVKSYLIGKSRISKTPWLIAYYIVLTISLIDCILSLALECSETIRLRRYLRPFFLIQSSSLMKKTIKSLKRAMPQIASVFVLLIIHLYFFAIIGMLLFPRFYPVVIDTASNIHNKSNSSIKPIEIPNIEFASILDSLLSLLILVTTSNNPDVTLQSYSYNRFSALYFVTFVMIGIYAIMALITAVVYNQFKGFFRDSMTSSAYRQSLGVRAAFWILYDQFKDEENHGLIPKTAVSCCIQNLAISHKRKQTLLKNLNELSFCIQDTDDLPNNIDLEQFEKLFFDNLNGKNNDEDDDVISEVLIINEDVPLYQQYLLKTQRMLKSFFETSIYLFLTCFLTFLNIVCITLELHCFIDDNDTDYYHTTLSYFILFFSIYYFVETILKLWAFKWNRYSKDFLKLADGTIAIVFFVLQIVHISLYGRPYLTPHETDLENSKTTIWGISRVVNMLFILRLIHVAPSVKIMYTILSTLIDILKSLKPLFGIMICVYYVYALIGMQLFSNKINVNSFDKYNKSNLDEYCGTYKQLKYWPLNFNDFYSSLIVLWTVMVINNWQVIIQAFSDATNKWSILYFVFWWIICTIIVLNMCVSLILDLYVLKWETTSKENNRNTNTRRNTRNYAHGPLIKSIHRLFNDQITRADDAKINQELFRHNYIKFSNIIVPFETITDFQ